MRGIVFAVAVAAGIALGGAPGVSAAPASGSAILDGAAEPNPVVRVQHWRWGSWGHGPRRSHWRWGSGGWGWGWGGCRVRCNPWRCWRVCW